MSTRTSSRNSASAEREHHRTSLWAQLARFIGLFLSPFIALFAAWLVHIWVAGFSWHWGPIDWEVQTAPAAATVAVCLSTLITVWLAITAWNFAEHRKPWLRGSLAGSVAAIGILFAINVGTGPHRWWSPLMVAGEFVVALIWTIARLDVTRNDKQAEGADDGGFMDKLKGWRARKVTPVTDEKGEVLATRIEFQHADGGTVDELQDTIPNMESASGSPAGMSYATPSDRADRSTATIMHRDPLKKLVELPPTSAPGAAIVQALRPGAKYANGKWLEVYLFGSEGREFSPSSYMFMGMVRAGKTQAENALLTEMISRKGVVILYLNKAKGLQDLRPIVPGIEAAVVADEQDSNGLYRQALRMVKRILSYRQRELALFGIDEWTYRDCVANLKWRTDETGRRVQMAKMPFLVVHVGEADAILQSDGGEATYLASKGLSVGISTGWSLQRADHTKMPTGLRFNLGTVWCFGCSDDGSASFALSTHVIKAGAHPERWGQTKPGYHYFEGLGIDDADMPVALRSAGIAEGGGSVKEEMLRRNAIYGPQMDRLDEGSVNATKFEEGKEPWWTTTVRATDELRAQLMQTQVANMTASDEVATPEFANEDDGDGDDEAAELQLDRELEQEMRETEHVEDLELYPADPDTGERASIADATRPLQKARPQDHVSWGAEEEAKPGARDKGAAIAAMVRACDGLFDDESLRDPADPSGNTIIVTPGMIAERYEFRSRPWFSGLVAEAAAGRVELGHYTFAPAPDLGITAGKYRLRRPAGSNGR